MKRIIVSLGAFFIVALMTGFPMVSHAQVELTEGMAQGEFALWLVKATQAQIQGLSSGRHAGLTPSVNLLLNPAAGPDEAIKFLTEQLGLAPEGGWQKDEALTNEALASLLESPEDAEGLSFDELVEKVSGRVSEKIQELSQKQAVFTAGAAGTVSAPAA